MKMTKIDLDLWLNALRSGEYKQGKGYLFDGTGFCCLGVLEKVMGTPLIQEGYEFFFVDEDKKYGTQLVSKTMKKFSAAFNGFNVPADDQIIEKCGFSPGYKSFSLSFLNDFGVSFEDISNYIEKYVEVVESY